MGGQAASDCWLVWEVKGRQNSRLVWGRGPILNIRSRTPNSAAMGCSQPKLSRTGLRNILAFLKVELQHFLGGTRVLLPLPEARGLMNVTLFSFRSLFCA